MEGKFMRQNYFSGENLEDVLLSSFLNDEYEELQEDVQENIFQLQDCESENEDVIEEDVQENKYNLKQIQENKDLSPELATTCSTNINNKQMLGQVNAIDRVIRKRKVEVLETKQNIQESEDNNHIPSTEATTNKLYYDNNCLKRIHNNEDNKLMDKFGILENEKITSCNEVIRTNGSIQQKFPKNTTENADSSTRQDGKAKLQSEDMDIGIECSFACNSFILSAKTFFFILLFLYVLYHIIIEKR